MAIRRPARPLDRAGSKVARPKRPTHANSAAPMTAPPSVVPESPDVAPALQPLGIDAVLAEASVPNVAALVTETLMETVSPDALSAGKALAENPLVIADTSVKDDEVSEDSSPAVLNVSDIAQDGARNDAFGHRATDDGGRAKYQAQPASLLPAEIENAIASAQDLTAQQPNIAPPSALSEITAANDTLATYVRHESIATLAHWRALSTAKNPADVVRLQVNEMQRAADASLSCIVSLARRAGRIAATLRRN